MLNLLQLLVKKGIVEKDKANLLEFEIKSLGKPEEEIILEKRLVSEEFLFGLKSESLKTPLKKIVIQDIPLKTLELIPEESAKFYQMIPIALKDGLLDVGMVYPEDLKAQEALKFLSRQGKFSYRTYLIIPTDFRELLRKYRDLKKEVNKALEELETEIKGEGIKKGPALMDLERLVEEAPISKVVAVILRHAVEGGASDIHIEPTKDKLRIRFRTLGILHSSLILPLKVHPAVVARIKILSNMKIDETRVPQDGRFSTKVDDKEIDFRVSTFPTTLGEKIAIRVLDPTTGVKNFNDLGLIGRNFDLVKEAIDKPYGLILVTGPTGCGKSTTLYTILRTLNNAEVNIMTLEDPVEYYIEGVNQSQVRAEIGYEFATGLRHMLRQDPDIIMVGEIRDEETATLAIHAALTGHLVLSTLHTNNATGVIPRLVDIGIKPYLIPPTLSVAIAQRLVRSLCPFCRKKTKASHEIETLILKEIETVPEALKKQLKIVKPLYIYQPQGCKKCNNEGYTGRSGVFEVLAMNNQLAEIILKDPSEITINQEARKQGMTTMKQDGILKALGGMTTIEEVLRVAEEK